jgi:hypothetical protein
MPRRKVEGEGKAMKALTKQLSHRKEKLLEACEKNMGLISYACAAAGLSRQTFYDYYRIDPEFKRRYDELEVRNTDMVELALMKKIQQGDTQAILFYLKTKGRKRGFMDKESEDNRSVVQIIIKEE